MKNISEVENLDELIAKYKAKWISSVTRQIAFDEVKIAIDPIWQSVYNKVPKIVICDSPKSCKAKAKEDGLEVDDMSDYFSLWSISYAATYELATEIGVEFDQEKFTQFINWAKDCHYILFNEDVVYVSQNPISLHLDDRERLSNEDGMAIEYKDGWGCYAINGVALNEQIVMRPETQTVQDIQGEQNAEVQLIRIERFGYEKYLELIGAELIDEVRNDIEGTLEFLMRGSDITILLTNCPSTRKRFSLRVPNTINTCHDAQSWLSSGLSTRIISAS